MVRSLINIFYNQDYSEFLFENLMKNILKKWLNYLLTKIKNEADKIYE